MGDGSEAGYCRPIGGGDEAFSPRCRGID